MTNKIKDPRISPEKKLIILNDHLETNTAITLKSLLEKYGSDARIEVELDAYSDCVYFRVYWDRLETDEEVERRLDFECRMAQARKTNDALKKTKREAYERKEYERLKKKFEGKK